MSRIIVKNLPSSMTEKELRKLFCKNGEITDCSLKYTPEGVFRKFAFVGYKTEEEAKSAVNNLNNSFINTSKVEVSFANDLHDSSNKLRPWSKHSKQNKSTKTSKKEGGQTDKVESGPSWSLKMTGLPPGVKLADIVEFFNPIPCKVLFPQSGKAFTKVNVSFESEEKRDEAMRRNKNYIGAKKIFLHKTTVTEVQVQNPVREKVVTTDSNDAEVIAETGRLFLRNLAYCCKEEDIETLFGKFGPLEVHLPIDKFTKKPKGFGFVEFILPENALTAYQNLDRTIFQGRMLHIVGGQAKKDELENIDDLPFAKKKELLKKKSASNSKNWNTLFVGADAVAAVMAQKFGTTKHDLLLEDGKQSAAVRLALGQTQIVGDTRQFLLDNGISLDSFSQASAERSKTVFLVKHLPAGTTTEQLQPVFAPFGEIKRLLLAPYGLTAIIEFAEPTEARSAYRSLAYTKFLHVPLYLEWAPVDVFLQRSEEIAEKSKDDDSTNVPEETYQLEDGSSSESDVDEDEPGRTVFVKNLSIVTTEDELKEIFSKCGKVRSVNLTKSKKEDPTEGTCFGFVEFTTSSSAEEAIRQLQRSTINSKHIELKISDRIIKKQPKEKKKSSKSKQKVTTKILIRNVPFQATQKDITILFSADTGVKSIRLPKKLSGTGSHRGFAFVEFLTKHDAKRAFNRLCHNTALYGRRLDLEWATTEADQSDLTDQVSQIRKRTASRYHPEDTAKKHKKSELLEELKISG